MTCVLFYRTFHADVFIETGEGMPEAERKRFAAKAVNDLMKGL